MNPFVFNPTAEYDTIGYANYTNLGSHNCDCTTTDIENKSSFIFNLSKSNIKRKYNIYQF